MPEKAQEIFRLGPWKGVDLTNVGAVNGEGVKPGHASLGTGANPNRNPGALTAAEGRTNLTQITILGVNAVITALAYYDPSFVDEVLVGCAQVGPAPTFNRFTFDPATNAQVQLLFSTALGSGPADTVQFNEAVQFGNTLYDNGGHQYSSTNLQNTFIWQNGPPVGTYTIAGGAAGTITYYYAFTQVWTIPGVTTTQETSSSGDTLLNFNVAAQSATPNITITPPGAFSGTNSLDGSTFTTNIYRMSSQQAVWHFVTNQSGAGPYIDGATDASIAANTQLTPRRDPPPCSNTNLGALTVHKNRLWVFVVLSNALTFNVPQVQMWYSSSGRPWEFDNTNGVLLFDDNEPRGADTAYAGAYGDIPLTCKSFSSIILAWRRHTLWQVIGDDPTTFRAIKLFDVGCLAQQSPAIGLVGSNNSVLAFWLAPNGVMMTDGVSPYYIGEPLRGFINTLSTQDLANAMGFFARNTYFLSFPAANVTFAYYTPSGEWYGPLPYATSAGFSFAANPATWGNLSQVGEVTAARNGTAFIDQWFSGGDKDLGNSQVVTWTGPIADCGTTKFIKNFSHIVLTAPLQPGKTATVSLTVDPGSTNATGGPNMHQWSIDLGKGSPQHVINLPDNMRGALAQMTVSFGT